MIRLRARLRWLGPISIVALFLFANPASADDVPITTTILSGTRALTTASIGTLANVVRTLSTSATLTATVTELAVNGDATGWSVTVRLCGPNNTTTPTAADCGTYPDEVVQSGGATTIAGSNVTISSRSVTPTAGGGTTTAVAGTQDLSTTRTIFNNSGQVNTTLYTGTYLSTSTISLTPPSNANTAVYNGYLVVTLVQ